MEYPNVTPYTLPPKQTLFFVDAREEARTRFSPDRVHRYTLFRVWGPDAPYCVFFLLNPSAADEFFTDRTVTKVIGMSQRWGYGAMYVLNAFALRSTDPRILYQHADPVGPENDMWIRSVLSGADRVVLGWGEHAVALGRQRALLNIVRETCDPGKVFCFGRNESGAPVHPLTRTKNITAADLQPFVLTGLADSAAA